MYNCLFSNLQGSVYYLSESGECLERFSMEAAILSLLLNEERQVLVVITLEMILTQFSITTDGQATQVMTVRSLMHTCVHVVSCPDPASQKEAGSGHETSVHVQCTCTLCIVECTIIN